VPDNINHNHIMGLPMNYTLLLIINSISFIKIILFHDSIDIYTKIQKNWSVILIRIGYVRIDYKVCLGG
jgi:hypothetical protein